MGEDVRAERYGSLQCISAIGCLTTKRVMLIQRDLDRLENGLTLIS